MNFSFKATIKGAYVSMKNQRRVVRFGNRSALIKKQKALDWEELACMQVRRPKEPYLEPVALLADFYYDNVRADLDPNLLMDMLQVKKPGKPCLGVLKDDNQIKAMQIKSHVDKLNPRVEFRLLDMASYLECFEKEY